MAPSLLDLDSGAPGASAAESAPEFGQFVAAYDQTNPSAPAAPPPGPTTPPNRSVGFKENRFLLVSGQASG